jgi:succinoglycan biosynthesis transport protein ExoP
VNRGGAEAIKAALRRSVPLIVALVVLGVVGMNALSQARGAKYQASTRVLLTTSDVESLLTGNQPVFVDPDQVHDSAIALASSPELFARVAPRNPGLGSADEIEASTEVSGKDKNIVAFTVTTGEPERSQRIANALATEFIRWRAEIAGEQVQRAVEALKRQIANEPAGSARRAELQQRLSDLETLAGVPSGGAVIIKRATDAPKTSPAPVKDTVLGALIGLMAALLVVGIREALDTKVRSEEDIEELLDIPVLATVQSLPRRARLVMFGRNEELYGDAYALLAANLAQAARNNKGTTIAVTSAIASEGKTSTAANLAVALARRGHKVVLADFDVRRPSLGEIFHIPLSSPGVSQLVAGTGDVDDSLWTISLNGRPSPQAVADANGDGASAPGEGSLRVLPAGGLIRSGSVSQSPRVKDLLEELRKTSDADIVILDTPPALVTVEMAELSRNVDSVLVVVRQGRVSRRSLRALARQVHSWRTKPTGAILTDAPSEERHSYYYKAS